MSIKFLLQQFFGANWKFAKKEMKESVLHGLKLIEKGEVCRKDEKGKWKSKK